MPAPLTIPVDRADDTTVKRFRQQKASFARAAALIDKRGFFAGCGTRIRTQTNRVRVCRATLTQFRNIFSLFAQTFVPQATYIIIFSFRDLSSVFLIFFVFFIFLITLTLKKRIDIITPTFNDEALTKRSERI